MYAVRPSVLVTGAETAVTCGRSRRSARVRSSADRWSARAPDAVWNTILPPGLPACGIEVARRSEPVWEAVPGRLTWSLKVGAARCRPARAPTRTRSQAAITAAGCRAQKPPMRPSPRRAAAKSVAGCAAVCAPGGVDGCCRGRATGVSKESVTSDTNSREKVAMMTIGSHAIRGCDAPGRARAPGATGAGVACVSIDSRATMAGGFGHAD